MGGASLDFLISKFNVFVQAIDVSGIPFIVFWIDEKEGREVVIEFVEDNGGYLGVCAGSYLATHNYSWSLDSLQIRICSRMQNGGKRKM